MPCSIALQGILVFGDNMADENQTTSDDATPVWARSILEGLHTLVGDMNSRLKAIEEQTSAESTKGQITETNQPASEPNERKPKRYSGFLSAWDRD